jgi:2-C-methyl-D-erythritol 2,4-cyclodiphosphate synthase
MNRIGLGYDIHRLQEGEQLVLGGVEIDSPVGTVGHSDADVLIHAIIDAILGAAALDDIGEHFPPSDPAYLGISSRELLRKTVEMARAHGFVVGNVDAVIVLAADLGIDMDAVSVKAKTKEGMDAAGALRAVEAQAVVLLEER